MGWHVRPPHYHHLEEVETERRMSNREIFARLLRYLTPYKKWIAIITFAVIVTSVTGIASPYILGREIISKYILKGDLYGLQAIILVFMGIQIANWAANTIRIYGLGKVGQSLLLKMRTDLFSHLQRLSFSFFDRSDSGDLISRVTNDTDAIGEAFTSGLVQVSSDMLSLLMIVIVMFSIDIRLSLASMTVVPLILIAAILFNSKFRAAYRMQRTKISTVTSKLQEGISGIREIQSFTRERDMMEDFKTANLENFQANLQATKVWGSFFPTIQLIQTLGTGIVILYGGWLAFNGMLGPMEEAIGTLITFIMYVGMFFGPIFDLANFYNTVQSSLAAAERIFRILDIEPEIKDDIDAIEIPRIEGEIEFRDVTFGYRPENPVLHDISFHVKPKETIALVGPTGAGKSTIIKLLCRFYDPQSGQILIDGYDVKKVKLKSLRRQMGIVLQETFLFSGTIIDNIRYGKPEATDEEVIAAAKLVGAHEFIEKLPDGYYTKIGEGGVGLSVGQKQLVSFARALLRDPAILILDEATSSIDPYTDLLIRKAMKTLLKDRTSIIIAHRLSTVRDVDRILVIDDGRIVEEGSHEELIKKGGLYSYLYKMQFKEPEAVKTVATSPH
ncbi:ABC transporter ATP-binding protein [Candidatus Bathyarchaeota archaeon]|nr:MAG: ABC transporter ATP-binding protein [Candidatus Bathyarchaeota archaeon]